jgi:putative endonuclease
MVKLRCKYVITNDYNTTLFIGVASNLAQRIYQHKDKLVNGFSAKYNLNKLVKFEQLENMDDAIL